MKFFIVPKKITFHSWLNFGGNNISTVKGMFKFSGITLKFFDTLNYMGYNCFIYGIINNI